MSHDTLGLPIRWQCKRSKWKTLDTFFGASKTPWNDSFWYQHSIRYVRLHLLSLEEPNDSFIYFLFQVSRMLNQEVDHLCLHAPLGNFHKNEWDCTSNAVSSVQYMVTWEKDKPHYISSSCMGQTFIRHTLCCCSPCDRAVQSPDSCYIHTHAHWD